MTGVRCDARVTLGGRRSVLPPPGRPGTVFRRIGASEAPRGAGVDSLSDIVRCIDLFFFSTRDLQKRAGTISVKSGPSGE